MPHHLFMLAQDANDNARQTGAMFGAAFGCCFFVAYIALLVVVIIGMWKVFVKARQPGWASIIPFFNLYILTIIAGRPILWFILLLIPVVNIVAAIIVCIDIAKYFGKGTGYAVGLVLLPFVFFPMLGFSKATYSGPAKPFST